MVDCFFAYLETIDCVYAIKINVCVDNFSQNCKKHRPMLIYMFINNQINDILFCTRIIMDYISGNDYYELSSGSLISDIDLSVVTELYQPIIGYKALSIYFTMVQDIKRRDYLEIHSHDSLLNRMQMSPGEFLNAKKALEATGLLRTFFKEEKNIRYFIYTIFSPKNPKDFFEDILFKGLLIKYVGEKETQILALKYEKKENDTNYTEITAPFGEVFNPDFNDRAFLTNIDTKIKGRNTARINTEFDFSVFFELLNSKSLISKQAFNDKELKEIERLATLYGLCEDSMTSIVSNIYNPDNAKGSRINFDDLNSICRQECKFSFLSKKPLSKRNIRIASNTELASKIKMMESTSPGEYLKIKQNFTAAADADLKILNTLSSDFALSNGTINALVDYVLAKQNNKLIRSYTEKLAAMLAREGVNNAVDTMNYLLKVNSYKKSEKNLLKVDEKEANQSTDERIISDEEYQKIIEQFNKGAK